jgi:uncharacterized protein (DUF4415 family)
VPAAVDEPRFVTLGLSNLGNLLVVVYTYRDPMKKAVAEKYRDIDFSRAKRGAVVKPEPGKTKISIRLDNTVIEFFRAAVDRAGGGNYQTLINDALLEHIHRRSTLDAVRQVVREELAPYGDARGSTSRLQRKRSARR